MKAKGILLACALAAAGAMTALAQGQPPDPQRTLGQARRDQPAAFIAAGVEPACSAGDRRNGGLQARQSGGGSRAGAPSQHPRPRRCRRNRNSDRCHRRNEMEAGLGRPGTTPTAPSVWTTAASGWRRMTRGTVVPDRQVSKASVIY
jgi:hypothetical protein